MSTAVTAREALAREMRSAAAEAIRNAEAHRWTGDELSLIGWSAAAAVALRRENEALERAAVLVEGYQESLLSTHAGDIRHLAPRKAYNLMGIAYAQGIRAMKVEE